MSDARAADAQAASEVTAGGERASVSVCMPSVRAGSVQAAIESVRRQDLDRWELIIVMQGDDAELRAQVADAERADRRVRGIWIPKKGVSRARNAGVAAASHDTIAFIDDDCEASTDWLSRLLQALAEDPSVGVVAGALQAPPKIGWRISKCPESIPRDFTYRPATDGTDAPDGARFVTANCAIRRSVWDRVGAFDEALGAGEGFRGGEDLDYLLRTINALVPIRFTPDAVVRHTDGTRHGLRAVLGMGTAYASGQGAVAAKLTAGSGDGTAWRTSMRYECLIDPIRTLRIHRLPARLMRLFAFERAYRRCLRDFAVDDAGLLTPRAE